MTTATAFVLCAGLAAVVRLVVSAPLNARFALPLGTLLVNVTGSLALGLLAGAAPGVVTAVGAGAIGTYTTYSTFALEAAVLGRRAPGLALTYVTASVVGCTLAAWVGIVVAG